MGIRLGVLEFERSTRPVKSDDLRQVLAVGGKDLIRLAWSSLNPGSDNYVKKSALAVWLCEFFNMPSDEGHGSKCIRVLCDMNLLHEYHDEVRPDFEY